MEMGGEMGRQEKTNQGKEHRRQRSSLQQKEGEQKNQQGRKKAHNLNQEQETAGKEMAEERIRFRHGGGLPKEATDKTLKILYTTAQSIQSKLGELEKLSSKLDPDFILLTENWCNPTVSDYSELLF
jgi:hypothetical protein